MTKEKKTRKRRPLAIWYNPDNDADMPEAHGFVGYFNQYIYEPQEHVTSPAKLREMWLEVARREDLPVGTARIVTLGDPLPKIVRETVVRFADEKPLAKSPKGE